MSCSINNVSVAQICANTADGDMVNDPAPCENGQWNIGRGYFQACTKDYLVQNTPGSYQGSPSAQQIGDLKSSCFSCSSSRENFIQAPVYPWAKPTAYNNLSQTWGSQKPYQL